MDAHQPGALGVRRVLRWKAMAGSTCRYHLSISVLIFANIPFFLHTFRLVQAHCTDTSLIYLLLS
jgi:hypothetical protein